VSRLTVRKILRDALLRGAITVTYRGRTASYELTTHGHILINQMVFGVWWRLGRPRLDGGFNLDDLQTDIYTTFLLERYPLTKIKVSREECPELFATYPDYVMAADFRLIDIYRSLSRRITNYEREVEAKIRAGHDIMAINRWIIEREVEGWPEDVILHRVSAMLMSGLACRKCFERGRISELVKREDGYECLSCSRKYGGAENFLKPEFEEWLKHFEEGGTPLKIGRLLIFPPRLKSGLLSSPSPRG
jgi:putative hemolysin